MLNRFLIVALALFCVSQLVACKSLSNNDDHRAVTYELINKLNTNQQKLSSQLNSQTQTLQNLQAQQSQLLMTQQQNAQEIAQLAQRVNHLQQSASNSGNVSSQQVVALQAQIKAVDQARIQDGQRLAEALTKQLNGMSNQLNDMNNTVSANAQAQRAANNTKATQNAVPPGEYYKHKVEAGQTLSVIAKAYKVSVAEVQKVNKLKDANIRVGQELLIPKK